jgi:hypothetical protein
LPRELTRYGTVVVLCRMNVTPVVEPFVTTTLRGDACPAASVNPIGIRTAIW